MAEFDDSNAEIVQIYRKSVLPKFLQWAVNIHLIIDREKFALCTRWRDNRESSLKFYGKPASFEKYQYLWLYLAELDDSNAEIVQIYRKSVLSKLLQCAVNIHLIIIDREKFALCTRWRHNRESSYLTGSR